MTTLDVGDVLEILGLVSRTANGGTTLDPGWFDDPFGAMTRVLTDEARRERLTDVLTAALGTLGGITDSPVGTGPDGEQWTSLVRHRFPGGEGDGSTVALALVTTPHGPGTVEVGVGARLTLRPSASPFSVTLGGVVPLARVITTHHGTRPVTTAAPVAGALRVALGAGPLGDPASVGMTAVDLAVAVPLDGTGALEARLSTSGLHVDGAKAEDLDLDLVAEPAETGAAVIAFLLRLARAGSGSDLFGAVLDVAGLGESAAIPALDLDDLLAGRPTAPGRTWLAALLRTPPAGTADPLRAWLSALATVATELAPDGTAIAVAESAPGSAFELRVGAFRLTVTRRPEGTGERVFVRLAVATPEPSVPADPDEPGGPRAEVVLDLLSVLLDVTGAVCEVRPGARLDATVSVGLLDRPLLRDPIRVAIVRVGLAADSAAGLRPVVELLGVTIEDDTYERLDLTSVDVRQAVTGSVLGALVENLAGPRARAAAVLLGLAAPQTPPPSGWPTVPDPELLTAPLRALAGFARALATDHDRWQLLLAHVPVLLGNAAEPAPEAVTGEGGTDSTDEVVLCTDSNSTLGSIVLRTSRHPDALRFGLAVRPPALGTGPTVAPALTADLFRLDLSADTGPHLALTPHIGLDITFASDEPVALGVAKVGPLRATLGVRVDVGTRTLTGRLAFVETAIEVNGVTTSLAPLRVDGDTTGGLGVTGGIPWDALELLAGAALCALDDGPSGLPTVLAALAGWAPWLPAATVTLPGTFADVPVRVALDGFPVLSLAGLVADPGDALRVWARRLAGDEDDAPPVFTPVTSGPADGGAADGGAADGDDPTDQGDSWQLPEEQLPGEHDRTFDAVLLLSSLLPGGAPCLRASLAGLGTRANPWLLPLTPVGTGGPALALWLRRARPPRPPREFAAALDGAGEPSGLAFADQLARVCRIAASFAPELADDLGDPTAAATLLAGLVDAVADTDGVTPTAVHADIPAPAHHGGHLGVPARLGEIVAGLGEPLARERTVLIAPDLAGLAPWDLGGPPTTRLVLGEPTPGGLPATGPWAVAVPEPPGASDEDRAAAAAAALARTVRDIAAASPPGSPPLTLVALGPAGRAARRAGTELGGVVGTVLAIATPWTPSAEQTVPRHAVELLLRLRRAAAGSATTPATELMDTLVAARTGWVARGADRLERHPFPLDGYRSPSPTPHATARELQVTVGVSRDELRTALLTLVTEAALAEITTGGSRTGAAQGFGLGIRAATTAGPGGLRLTPSVRLDLPGLTIASGPDSEPDGEPDVGRAHWLQADFRLCDVDGWLADDEATGADAAPTTTRVGRATLRLAHDPVTGRFGADLVLRHTEVFGDRTDALAIGLDDERPELVRTTMAERAVASRAFARLGAFVPLSDAQSATTADPVTALAGLLADLGLLVRSGTTVVTPVEAVERFLTDPATALARLRTTAPPGGMPGVATVVAARLATLLALPVTAVGGTLTLGGRAGDVALVLDLATPALGASLSLPIGPLTLKATARMVLPGADLTCDIECGAPDAPTLRVAIPGGRTPTVRADVVLPATLAPGGAVVPVLPRPELDETLGRLLLGEVARALLDAALATAPDRLRPLLTALGLVNASSTRCNSPLPLLLDSPAWLRRPEVLGTASGPANRVAGFDLTRVTALMAAVPPVFGAAAGTPVGLPGGGALLLTTTGARPGAQLSWRLPNGQVTLGVSPVDGAWEGTVQVSGTLPIEGGGPLRSIGIDAGLTDGVANLAVVVATAGGIARLGVLPVKPLDATAVGELAAGAAHLVVPIVLDALATGAPPTGQPAVTPREWTGRAVAALGDALGVRVGGAFSADRLTAFRKTPVPFLAEAFDAAAALEALAEVLATALPDIAATEGADLALTIGDATLRLTPGDHTVDATASLAVTTASVRIDLSAHVTGRSGFEAATGSVRFTGDTLAIGRIVLHPEVSINVGLRASGGAHLTGTLTLPSEPHRLTLTVDSAGAVNLTCVHGESPVAAAELPGCLLDVARAVVLPALADLALLDDDLQEWLRQGEPPRGEPLEGSFLERDPSELERLRRRDEALAPGKLLPNVVGLLRRLTDRLGDRALALGEFVAVGVATGGDNRYGVWVGLRKPLTLVRSESLDLSVRASPGAAPAAAGGGRITVLLVDCAPPGPGETLPRISMRPEVGISGVGLRVGGAGGAPLLTGSVVSLGALGLYGMRAGPGDWSVRLDVEALGIGLGSAAKGNAVATNLLAPPAGSDKAAAAPGEASPTAPAVDVVLSAGPHGVTVGLRGESTFPVWLPVQRAFGPLHLDQIGIDVVPPPGTGVRLTDLTVDVVLDGAFLLGPLAAVVDNLRLSVKLGDPRPSEWTVGVDGFAVSMDGEAVRIAGGLRRPASGDGDYLGFLSLQAASFGISLFGGYGRYPTGHPEFTSLFVFGALKAPLGGPPPFFLTGIGAGAGVNRGLRTVPIEQVESHPMVRALGTGLAAKEAFESLVAVFPPSRGSYWFAAGVSFTSFVFVDSVAVLTVQFDPAGFEIGLMGISRFTLPDPDAPVAHIEVALDGRFSSRHRSLIAQAAFTGKSWIVDPSCRITGGIAVGMWWGSGDFVVTLGGFHPNFAVPLHYPVPERLGIEWRPKDGVVISARGYFALTPRAIMTGAELEVAVEGDWFGLSLKAWFHALLQWDPFHYELTIGISVTGWARLGPFEVSATVGADVTLSGPPLHVAGHVRLGPVSIPFAFGDTARSAPTPLPWAEFRTKYLDDGGKRPLTDVTVTTGRPDPQSKADGRTTPWRVLPEFTLTTRTALPCTEFNGAAVAGVGALGVPSMWVTAYTAVHEVHVVARNGRAADVSGVSVSPVTELQPVAAFGSFDHARLVEGRLDGGAVSVTGVTGAVVRTQRQTGASMRVRSGTLESPVARSSPFAFAAEVRDRAGVATPEERPVAVGTATAAMVAPDVTPDAPTAGPDAAAPVATAPSLETVVPVPQAAGPGAVDRTTVSGATDLPRVAAPRLADAVTAARRAGARAEIPGNVRAGDEAGTATAAATTATRTAQRLAVWRAADRRTPSAPDTLVAGDGTPIVVALRVATVWRAGAHAGVLRWDADAPTRVLRITRAGVVTADEHTMRGQFDLPPGAAAVVLGGGETPAAVAAGWVATDPVVWLDRVTGVVPGGIVHASGVPGSSGARSTGPLPAGARIAVAAPAAPTVSAVAVLFATPVERLPDRVRLTVGGSAPTAAPAVVPTPDGGTALVWTVGGTGRAPLQAVLDADPAPEVTSAPVGLVLSAVAPEPFAAVLASVPASLLTGSHRTAGSAVLTWAGAS